MSAFEVDLHYKCLYFNTFGMGSRYCNFLKRCDHDVCSRTGSLSACGGCWEL